MRQSPNDIFTVKQTKPLIRVSPLHPIKVWLSYHALFSDKSKIALLWHKNNTSINNCLLTSIEFLKLVVVLNLQVI